MSRYIFTGNEPGLSITVGWDQSLETYFIQVWGGGEPEAGNLRLWVGSLRGEVSNIDSVTSLLEPYAKIPPELLTQLRNDFEERTPPTALQRLLGK